LKDNEISKEPHSRSAVWLLFCGMSIDAGIALGIFCHKLTINIKNVLTNIKSEIVIYKKGE
jgi:hypothetical protein